MSKKSIAFFMGLLFLGLGSKWLPLPANFTPILAIAIIAGSHWGRSSLAFVLPLLILVVSDVYVGFYQGFEFVYLGMGLVVFVGAMNLSSSMSSVVKFFASSLGFFAISNFGVWLYGGMYSMDFAGLIKCYTLAIPFLRTSLLSTFMFLVALSAVESVLFKQPSLLRTGIDGR